MLESPPGDSHVSVPVRGGRAKRPGIRIHRVPSIAVETTSTENIPVTRPGRTLADLRRTASAGEVRAALRQAQLQGLPLDGFGILHDRSTSELELLFLRLCRQRGLPAPETNVPVGRYRVDFIWADRGLIVETDGYRYHRGSVAFEEDHARDNHLMALGWDVLRFTYWAVVTDGAFVAGLIRARLERPRRVKADLRR